MKLSGVMLGSEKPKELADFYAKIFGPAGWHDGDWFGFDTYNTNLMIGPHSDVKGSNPEPARIIINFEVDDVQAEFKRIKDTGAKVVAEPYQPGKDNPDMWLATFADVDGNYFQLAPPWKDK